MKRRDHKTSRRGPGPAAVLLLALVVCAGVFICLRHRQQTVDLPVHQSTPSAVPSSAPSAVPSPVPDSVEDILDGIPPFAGEPYVELGDNIPEFPEEDMTTTSFERYSPLDSLGRCGTAYACVSLDTMPTGKREDIWQVKPTGWRSVRYDFVDGESLYNRCHLIGFQLTGENANRENLITGTRYMNVDGMLPIENQVAEYVDETGGHVLYRVTPIFDGDNLVASGVRMEAMSVEDRGEGVCFDVYVYNCQPGVLINYGDGASRLDTAEPPSGGGSTLYILNTKSRTFHKPDCPGALSMLAENRREYTGEREILTSWDYKPCGQCGP